jgi:hypothetical protein
MAFACSYRRGSDGAQCVLARGHAPPHDYDDRSFLTKEDSDPGERFSDEERITANLRLKSINPLGSTLLGVIALVPRNWRGPVLMFGMAVIGFLIGSKAPAFIHWLENK